MKSLSFISHDGVNAYLQLTGNNTEEVLESFCQKVGTFVEERSVYRQNNQLYQQKLYLLILQSQTPNQPLDPDEISNGR